MALLRRYRPAKDICQALTARIAKAPLEDFGALKSLSGAEASRQGVGIEVCLAGGLRGVKRAYDVVDGGIHVTTKLRQAPVAGDELQKEDVTVEALRMTRCGRVPQVVNMQVLNAGALARARAAWRASCA